MWTSRISTGGCGERSTSQVGFASARPSSARPRSTCSRRSSNSSTFDRAEQRLAERVADAARAQLRCERLCESRRSSRFMGAPPSSAASPYAPPSNSSTASTYLQQAEQEARQRRANERGMAKGSLNAAMWTMFVVGALTVIVNIFLFMNAEAEVRAVVAQNGAAVDPGMLLTFVRVFYALFLLSGVVMIILGALIYQFPLASPLTALIIYVEASSLWASWIRFRC